MVDIPNGGHRKSPLELPALSATRALWTLYAKIQQARGGSLLSPQCVGVERQNLEDFGI